MAVDRYLKLAAYSRKYWKNALAVAVGVVALTAFRVLVPLLLGSAVSDIVQGGSLSSILDVALEIVAVSLTSSVFQYMVNYGGQSLGQKMIYDMRNRIFAAIHSQSFSFMDRNETGQLMARATGDVEAVRRFMTFGFSQLLSNAFLVIGVIFSLLFLNTELALIVSLTFPALVFLSWHFAYTQGPFWRDARESYGAITARLQQNVVGARMVRAFSAQQYEMGRFEEVNEKYRSDVMGAAQKRALYVPLFSLIISVDACLLYIIGGRDVIAGAMPIGSLIAAVNLLTLLGGPTRFVGQLILQSQNGMAGFDRILQITEADVAVVDDPDAVELDRNRSEGHIVFRGVRFGYSEEREILKGIDLEIKPGEIVALLGASGSGKSTLASLIPRFYDVTGGAVLVDGVDVRKLRLRSLRSNVGIVSQDIFLFSTTIRENIAYGVPNAPMEAVVRASEIAHADEFIERFPDRYETRIGERGVTLSGGQKQRVAMARTLITDPHILILDDSLSSVDVQTEHTIEDALRAVVKNRTTIIITQRLSTLKLADRIVVFDDGRIVEDGTHDSLVRLGGHYARLYEAQLLPQSQMLEVGLATAPLAEETEARKKEGVS